MSQEAPYLMPAHTRLLVSDIERTVAFYEALGFTCVHRDDVFVHMRWAKYADVFLVATPNGLRLPGQRGLGVLLCFFAGEADLAEIKARAEEKGGAADGPKDQPWFTTELVVTDPDGYKLAFVLPSERIEA